MSPLLYLLHGYATGSSIRVSPLNLSPPWRPVSVAFTRLSHNCFRLFSLPILPLSSLFPSVSTLPPRICSSPFTPSIPCGRARRPFFSAWLKFGNAVYTCPRAHTWSHRKKHWHFGIYSNFVCRRQASCWMELSCWLENSARMNYESWSPPEFLCFMERTRRSSTTSKSRLTAVCIFKYTVSLVATYDSQLR